MTTFADATWAALESDETPGFGPFDPSTLSELPEPAQRFLSATLPDRTPLRRSVTLSMRGEIKLVGRWLPFTARQILVAGTGFVWAPVVGGRIVRFVGADALGPDGARIEFLLHGRIPIVRGSSPDVARSASGRLAAETVVWLPQALTPQAGARWEAIDHSRAVVTLDGPDGATEVEVAVDDEGRLIGLGLQRWKGSAKPPGPSPFGGTVDSTFTTTEGIAIAGSGTVGWDWRTATEAAGVFFRYEIIAADFAAAPSRTPHPREPRRPPRGSQPRPG